MKLTNKANLPPAIVRAVTNDPYSRGESDITVTELIGPSQIRRLLSLYSGEIEEDASDRIWALLGSATHNVVERAATIDTLHETRVYATVDGWRISGQFDAYETDTHHLWDVKVTSRFAILKGAKSEWVEQLNCLAWLIRQNGGTVKKLSILAILRDWNKRESMYDRDYPKTQVVMLPIKLWSEEQQLDFIMARLRHHRDATALCTDDERWIRSDYAVMKTGQKKAAKVEKDLTSALRWSEAHGGEAKGYNVIFRKGEPTRCQMYCPVAKFCEQYKQEKESEHGQQDEHPKKVA